MSLLTTFPAPAQTDPAARLLMEAQRLQRAGRISEAAQAYANALALRPSSPNAYLMASRFYEKQGQLLNSLAALKTGLQIAPKDFSLLVETGFIYAAMQDYAHAAEQFAKARDVNPGSTDNLYNLANAYLKASAEAFEREQWDECLSGLQKARETGQHLPRLNYLTGMAYFKKRNNNKAIEYLSEAVAEEPAVWQPHFDLGLALAAEARWKEARQRFTKVVELHPNFAPAYMYLGRALHEMNMSEKSVPLFEKAVKLDPKLPLAHYHLGFALKGLADYGRARQELLREVEINPGYAPAYFELGLIAVEKGSDEEALEYFRQSKSRQPGHPPTHYETAKVLAHMGSYAEAVEAYKAFLRLEPTSVEGHYGLYRALQRAGRKEEAEKILALYEQLSRAQRPSPE